MQILLVNWALPWDGATRGGGVNGYCQALALELVGLGHEVATLASGTLFIPASVPRGGPFGQHASDQALKRGACCAVRHPDWLGVRVFEIANSPVLAPSMAQFADPEAEIGSPELDAACDAVLGEFRPEVVHIQSLEGFGAGLVARARAAGCRVVFSLHNYHPVCPQVYLAPGHRGVCQDARGGARCEGCIDAPEPRAERQRQMQRFLEEHPVSVDPQQRPLDTLGGLIDDAALMLRRGRRDRSDLPVRWPLPVLGQVTGNPRSPENLGGPSTPCSGTAQQADTRGQTTRLLAELNACRGTAEPQEQQVPDEVGPDLSPIDNTLTNEPPPDPAHRYGRRRIAMLSALNSCDAVHAVSPFVADKYAALGVDRSRLITMPIGTRMVRIARWQRDMLFSPPPFSEDPSRPIRLVFMGYNNWQKGLPMLADSLERLPPEVLRRLHLAIWAFEGASIEWRFRRIEPRLAGLDFGYGYDAHDVPWMLGGRDLGLVPSVWWDNGPQTVLEFHACGVPVLAANAGGIPSMVRDGIDGLLHRANDREDLARTLRRVASDPRILDRLRSGVEPPVSIENHARQVVDGLYRAPAEPSA